MMFSQQSESNLDISPCLNNMLFNRIGSSAMTTQTLAPNSNAVPQPDRASITTDDILAAIKTWMREQNLGEPSDLNATFSDSGFDSLDSVQLSFFLQDEFGVQIDETVLYNYPTFATLIDYVKVRL